MERGRKISQLLQRFVVNCTNSANILGAMAGSDDDVIRVMTIHKSKGLEFPLVFVSGLGGGKGNGGKSGFASIDRGMGIAFPYVDTAKR